MRLFRFLLCLFAATLFGQNVDTGSGHRQFDNTCSVCHGGDGMGGELGPAIVRRLQKLDDQQIKTVIHHGLPDRGMPAFPNLTEQELNNLVRFLRTLKFVRAPLLVRGVQTDSGAEIEGTVLNQSSEDLELQSKDGRIHLLRTAGGRFREVTSQTDWATYNGDVSGNRYSKLSQITPANVSQLATAWTYTLPDVSFLESTPLVVKGILYVTSANECYALDAGNGRHLWHFKRPRTKGVIGDASPGINRGVAWAGNRLFMVTDNAHLLALNRFTGDVEWETVMADWKQNYDSTSAPLIVGDYVISGTAGGEEGARGFVAAFDQATGKEVWRFWTVPKPGEPGSETWKGNAI
ncbi:MAG TPA: PQQ-binding-like beta-propeller repeat protein, partial [Bryobacteraceae bacterium]